MGNTSLGRVIHSARKAAGLSLRDLAKLVGVNHAYISDIEHDRRVPSERVIHELVKHLDADTDIVLALAGRFGERADTYMREHPAVGILLREIASHDLDDDDLQRLIRYARGMVRRR